MDKEIESNMEKALKQLRNLELRKPGNGTSDPDFTEPFSNPNLEKELDSKSYQRIKDLFEKTEEMRQLSKEKSDEVEEQFESLKERLNGSSAFLEQMKNSIENLKFSYQKKILDMHNKFDIGDYLEGTNKLFQKDEDMENHMEEIRQKIEELRAKLSPNLPKVNPNPENYKVAFEEVVENLRKIDQGLYSSFKPPE